MSHNKPTSSGSLYPLGPKEDFLVRVQNLSVSFHSIEQTITAVSNVSFDISPHKTTVLVGESGSGKSVISQAILGILPSKAKITTGDIWFNPPILKKMKYKGPLNLAKLNPDSAKFRHIRGQHISIIFQEPMTSFSPLYTIGNQIAEAITIHHKASIKEAAHQTKKMLHRVGFPDANRAFATYPFELSGGLRQRAMIAMALVCCPCLLIADEPTTALDVTTQAQILKLIKDCQKELGMAVLMITHDLGVVANMADDVVVLYQGQVMEKGDVKTLFTNPQHPYLKALMQAVPVIGMPRTQRLATLQDTQVNPQHFLKKEPLLKPTLDPQNASPILSLQGLTKTYTLKRGCGQQDSKKLKALNNFSLTVKNGECLGLVGESGCGKTTLSKIIMRALTPDTGAMTWYEDEKPVDILALKGPELFSFRQEMQFIFQDPFSSLNPRMRTGDIIAEPLIIHNRGTPKSRKDFVLKLMELVGLSPSHIKRYPHSFSGGQRQRISVARALALQPKLLICDEPVSALDVSIQAQILNLLRDLQQKLGLSYIFISHNLAVVDYIADRIAVMCHGRLVELAPRKALFQNPMHPYTQKLLQAIPEPNLNHLLDFDHLAQAGASRPHLWPAPFTDKGKDMDFIELPNSKGHFISVMKGITL